MRKVNRKKNEPGRNAPMKVLLGAVFVIMTGVCFQGVRAHCEMLGSEIRRLESGVELSRRRLENEEFKWAELMTPRNIEEALTRHQLNLAWPRRGQVVRLYDSQATDMAWVDMRDAVRFAQLEQVALND